MSSMTAPCAASSARIQSCSVLQFVLGEEAARDAGLVGEEEHEIAGLVEAADRLGRIRHPADPLLRAHIAVVVIDDAVAVEEGGGPWRARAESMPLISRASRIIACSISSQIAVRDREMDLLDDRACRRWARPADDRRCARMRFALGAGEADGDKPALRAPRAAPPECSASAPKSTAPAARRRAGRALRPAARTPARNRNRWRSRSAPRCRWSARSRPRPAGPACSGRRFRRRYAGRRRRCRHCRSSRILLPARSAAMMTAAIARAVGEQRRVLRRALKRGERLLEMGADRILRSGSRRTVGVASSHLW